jgi:alpha-L-rhamnosidase
VIRPAIVGDLTWVKGRFDSVRGPITTGWRRESGRLILEITIPPGTTATVFVPAQRAEDVTEGGIAALTSPHARFLRQEKGSAVFEIDSGKYQFSVSPDKS